MTSDLPDHLKLKSMPTFYLDQFPRESEAAPGKGPIPAEYAIIGIAPSPSRPAVRFNEPFGSSSHGLLSEVIKNLGGSVYVTNLIKTPQPFKKKISTRLIREYYPQLIEEMNLVKPRKILVFGTEPAKYLCPGFQSLREDHGTLFRNPEIGEGKVLVLPTYHPAAVTRDPSRLHLLIRDLERFEKLELPEPPPFVVIDKVPDDLPPRVDLYLDLESTGVDTFHDRVTKLGFSWGDEPVVRVINDPDKQLFIDLMEQAVKKKMTLVGHHLQFDLLFISVITERDWNIRVVDTMVLAHVAGEEVLALKALSTSLTDRPGSRAFGTFTEDAYLAEDVLSTRAVKEALLERTKDKYVTSLKNALVPLVIQMTRNGVYVDPGRLSEILPEFKNSVNELQAELGRLSGQPDINWNSPLQVSTFLINAGVELTELTDGGKFSVKESVLLELQESHPAVSMLLQYREAHKLLEFLDDYSYRIEDDPFLHPRMKITGAVTGRTSCEDPNLQQVPRRGKIKLVFTSRWEKGLIGLLDLDQAELRAFGLLSGDEDFCKMLNAEDPHRQIASTVYMIPPEKITETQRKRSKAITFGLFYGGSPKGLSLRTGFPIREVNKVWDGMVAKFPGVMAYIKHLRRIGIKEKKISTAFGMTRDLSSLITLEGEKGAARKAINTPIQGTASEITLQIMWYVQRALQKKNLYSRVLFGIHDSIFFDIAREELDSVVEIAREAFVSLNDTPLADYPMWGKIPFSGELVVGESWAAVEGTNEYYNPEGKYFCSNLGGENG